MTFIAYTVFPLPSAAIGESSRSAEIGILSPVLFKVVITV